MSETPPAPSPARPLRFGLVLLLGAMTIIAPLSIDMYLAALPTLASAFGVSEGQAQLTLTSYFFGFAVGQAFYGPVIDRFGRKPPLYFGMGLFMIVSFGCAVAPSIGVLIALRFLHALGACAGGVVARAMVRDLFSPVEASRVYSALALVTGLGPLLAPLIGGYILVTLGWRAIFVTLGTVTLVLLAVVHFRVTETQRAVASVEARAQAFSFGRVIGGYWRLLKDRHYLGFGLSAAFALAGMFVYIAGAPFVLISLYHVEPQHFGWVFGGNALVLITGSQINGRIVSRFPPATILRRANVVQACAGVLLLAHGLTGFGGLAGFLIALASYTLCMGFIMPNAMVMAMAPHGRIAGMASALLGTLQFVIGASAASIASAVHSGTALPTTAGMALCAFCGLAANLFVVRVRAAES